MKQKRDRTIPREGPPCQRCGRPTQPRTNWQRVMAFLPVTGRFTSDHHHLCRRCYRKSRPNDRRTMPMLPRRGDADHHPAHRTGPKRRCSGPNPSQARTPPVLDAAGRMTKEVGSDRVPHRRHCHRLLRPPSWFSQPVEWRPVAGPPHVDEDLQPFARMHYHVDPRFLPLALRGAIRPSSVGRRPRVFSKVMTAAWPVDLDRPIVLPALLQARGVDSSWMRQLPRRALAGWPPLIVANPHTLTALEVRYADSHLVNGRCPHWGFDLATTPPNVNGYRTCPLHGLRWDADGRLVPWAANLMAHHRAAETHEVRRRLREGPRDPEFRDWASTVLAGRLRGHHAPLPTEPAEGLDEQDMVSDDEIAPVPPLPPPQALGKARTALAAAEAEATRYRHAVATETARMVGDGRYVWEGGTVWPWSKEWQAFLHVWETLLQNRDHIVADIRVLEAAADAR